MVKITLFGLAGTGTSTVGKLFSEKYNFKFGSGGNMFREMAAEHKMDVYEFNQFCQKDKKYDLELDTRIANFGKENDNFAFESRVAWNFIPDSIKIKIICDDDVRIERICDRDNKENLEEIKEKTKNREISEKKRYFDYYDIEDYSDDKHFDLIIDSTNLTPEEIIQKISEFVENK